MLNRVQNKNKNTTETKTKTKHSHTDYEWTCLQCWTTQVALTNNYLQWLYNVLNVKSYDILLCIVLCINVCFTM